jgi:hypothetical protein
VTRAAAAARWLARLSRAVSAGMARIVTPVAMFLLFAVVFVPIAVVLRLLGRRPLGTTAEAGWITRDVVDDWPTDFQRPF